MARQKSNEKRTAILNAAIRVIAAQGLSAPTALIAKEAGVSNGALFTYFATKADLLNQLYVDLKEDLATSTCVGLPIKAGMQDQVYYVWNEWLRWTIAHPQQRRTLAYLSTSNDVTAESHDSARGAFAAVEALLDRSRAHGKMRDAPLMFVASLVTSVVDATSDHMMRDPANAKKYSVVGFQALWRILT